ncbi:hypothetical protein [Nocardia sp. NPDC052566]|uniref:hypothetical protein n=1 Tax=Nocardia sp. NPDC052566 TaxID=3364330 RepID=UPI0037C9AC67
MLRTAGFLGAAAAAAMISVLAPGTAHAAVGSVAVGPKFIVNPSGCVNTEGSSLLPSPLGNYTDQVVTVYTGRDCTGTVAQTIQPDGIGTAAAAGSFSVN